MYVRSMMFSTCIYFKGQNKKPSPGKGRDGNG